MARAVNVVRAHQREPESVLTELDPIEWLRATAEFENGRVEAGVRQRPRATERAVAPPRVLRVGHEQLQRLVLRSARLVADLPPGSSAVVWTHADSELLVLTSGLRARCGDGVITITVPVLCDQRRGPSFIDVVFAVGSRRRAAGLVMSTTARPSGPEQVVARWSDALVAFAYETLIHVAAGLAAATGFDRSGRVFIPGAIAAEPDVLVVATMARHSIRWSM